MNTVRITMGLLVALLASLPTTPASAHKASDAYLTLQREGTALSGRWDIALRDLDNALGLDANGDGDLTWGEVRRRQEDIASHALATLTVSSAGERCTMASTATSIDVHTDGAYAVLALSGRCALPGPTLTIDYRLFAPIDPQHRGLLQFVEKDRAVSVVFSAQASRRVVGAGGAGLAQQFSMYLNEGVWHIWSGFDHILFLLSLLLPAVLVRARHAWQPASSFRASFLDVAKVVTAFTVAHSITLSLAALSIVTLPSRWVESVIALSVVLAALNNLFPVVANGRWIAAFSFGLLHGFGFAGALQDLGLPSESLALSLAAFNLGVEIGQLAIVLLFLPLAFALRSTWVYRRLVLGGGSIAIAALASVWLVERTLDVGVFSALAAP